MRDDSRKDPEIIAHLNEENSYLENWFVSGNDNRKALFEEITDRIPKNEDSVPIRLKNLFLDNLSGVNINAKRKPINIAVIDTAIVIRVA